MNRYKQVFLNEGHLIDAIFRVEKDLASEINVSRVLEIVSYPRDMIVPLNEYSPPKLPTTHVTFRRAEKSDETSLNSFVKREFGSGWLNSINNGFSKEEIPIFIAFEENEIIGFACYDVVRNKKSLFGPMGTSYSKRIKGVGYTLLHLCLNKMNNIGYEYAVLGEVGPIEFYEKACHATVIPKFF